MMEEMPPSIMPMEELRAAMNTSAQNSSWNTLPAAPMDWKTVVMETKSSPGPAPGSMP